MVAQKLIKVSCWLVIMVEALTWLPFKSVRTNSGRVAPTLSDIFPWGKAGFAGVLGSAAAGALPLSVVWGDTGVSGGVTPEVLGSGRGFSLVSCGVLLLGVCTSVGSVILGSVGDCWSAVTTVGACLSDCSGEEVPAQPARLTDMVRMSPRLKILRFNIVDLLVGLGGTLEIKCMGGASFGALKTANAFRMIRVFYDI